MELPSEVELDRRHQCPLNNETPPGILTGHREDEDRQRQQACRHEVSPLESDLFVVAFNNAPAFFFLFDEMNLVADLSDCIRDATEIEIGATPDPGF